MPVTVSVVFVDLDGTLVDTTYLHTQAWWKALAESGEHHPTATIHKLIGMGGSEMLMTLLGHDDTRVSERHDALFEGLHGDITPLPGASRLLREISAHGGRVVIVSSTPASGLGPLLEPLHCDDVIESVVHGEAADQAKPAPDLFQVALDRTGAGPPQAVAIGDAVWDVESAGKAGVTCIGVETGGTDGCRLSAAGAAEVHPSCAGLLRHSQERRDSLLGPLLG